MQNNQPYWHPAIKCIIQHIFFHGSSAATYDGVYHLSVPESDEPEVPIPMVALAATAVSVNLTSRWTKLETRQVHVAINDWGPFSASLFEDIYRRHVAMLESIKTANICAFHAITGSIYRNCL